MWFVELCSLVIHNYFTVFLIMCCLCNQGLLGVIKEMVFPDVLLEGETGGNGEIIDNS